MIADGFYGFSGSCSKEADLTCDSLDSPIFPNLGMFVGPETSVVLEFQEEFFGCQVFPPAFSCCNNESDGFQAIYMWKLKDKNKGLNFPTNIASC